MHCIIIDDDKTSRVLIESYIEKTSTLSLKGSFSNPIDALKLLNNNQQIDLIFLDILMPQMNGLQVLNNINGYKQVIVISGKKEFALESYNYNVTDYLLKPISYDRFFKAVSKAYEKDREFNSLKTHDNFLIKKEKSFSKIRYLDICFIEEIDGSVFIHTKTEQHKLSTTINTILSKLPNMFFLYLNPFHVINLEFISLIDDEFVEISFNNSTKTIPLSFYKKQDIIDIVNKL